jgi:hypothetical protein
MKRVVKIKESQLNDIIKKVISEQEQVMTTGPSPEQISGTPEADAGEPIADEGPNFNEFINCAKELLDQGVTIGNLIDQVLDAQEDNDEEDVEDLPAPNPEVDGASPDTPIA